MLWGKSAVNFDSAGCRSTITESKNSENYYGIDTLGMTQFSGKLKEMLVTYVLHRALLGISEENQRMESSLFTPNCFDLDEVLALGDRPFQQV